jgi:MSHA biogenesis protein MshI
VFGLLKKAAVVRGRTGITIHGDELALAVVRHQANSRPVLERCEVLASHGGDSPQAVAAALRAANLSGTPISILMPPSQYQLSMVEAPDVPPAELRAAMRWRLRETIDFPIEDAVIDVFEIPAASRGGQKRMVYAVIAQQTLVQQQIAALAAHKSFDAVDIPELALRNLASLLPASTAGVAMLYVADGTAILVLVRSGTFYLSRRINLQLSTPGDSDSAHAGSFDAASVALELQRSLDYYERNFDQRPIAQIAVAPVAGLAPAMLATLATETGLEVIPFDLNDVMECDTPLAPELQQSCLLAVGAALRVERRTL